MTNTPIRKKRYKHVKEKGHTFKNANSYKIKEE